MILYPCVVADPAWKFGDKLPGDGRGAEKNYLCMTTEQICDLAGTFGEDDYLRMSGREFFLAKDALLFLWRVSAMVEEAYQVVRAWGFVSKSEIVWQKLTSKGLPWFGMGRYVRASHETCIIAARGRAVSLVKNHSTRSVFAAPVGEHSAKPDAFYEIVERLVDGPRLELFARKKREGWECVGDEL